MKRILILLAISLIMLSLSALERFNPQHSYPNILVVCFDANAVHSKVGDIKANYDNGILQIGLKNFDRLAKKYQFTSMEQVFQVKDKEWSDNGVYPMNVFKIKLQDNSVIESALEDLLKDKNLLFAEYDPILYLSYVPNDPSVTNEWHINKIKAYQAWDYVRGDTTVVVGIVDSGVKWNHPDLKDNIWINWAEMPGHTINWANGTITGDGDNIDNDNNGKVDDPIGWDFYATSSTQDNNPFQSNVNNDHGTHVAGCAAAVGDNGIGVAGPGMHVKVMVSKHAPTNTAATSIYNGYSGITYCTDSGAPIINCSWGGTGGSGQANTACNYAYNHGSLVFAAAGNDGWENVGAHASYPSDATNAVCVASTNQSDQKSDFSNYGTGVEICAPGTGIYSTIIANNGYASFDGTSMACPVACGVASLIKTVHPEYTPLQLREKIMSTCDPIDDVNDELYWGKLGAGRVNAYAAAMSDQIPDFYLDTEAGIVLTELDGDGDNVPNPGELIKIDISVGNNINWLFAEGIEARLRCHAPGITVTDSVASYPDLDGGISFWNIQPFKFTSDQNLVNLTIPFELNISANQGAQHTYHYNKSFYFTVTLSMMHSGWPFSNGGLSLSPSVIYDINNDDLNEVIFGDAAAKIHALKNDGTEITGFPVVLAGNVSSAVAIADLNNDGTEEIIAGAGNNLYVVSATGSIIGQYAAGAQIKTCPAVADMDGNGSKEIVVVTMNNKVHVINNDGVTAYPNFPVTLDGPIAAPPAIGLIDGDNFRDIVVCTGPGRIYAISSTTGATLTGWPYNLGSNSWGGAIITNFDADEQAEIIVVSGAASNASMVVLNHDGTIQNSMIIPAAGPKGTAAMGDINYDGIAEFVFVTANGTIYCLNNNLQTLEGFPIAMGKAVESSPIIGDIDGDGQQEIIIGDVTNYINAYKPSGQQAANFPIYVGSPQKISAAIGVLDPGQPQKADLVFPNNTDYLCLDYKSACGAFNWPIYRLNPQHTGNTFDTPVSSSDHVIPVFANTLQKNYPNPFNPETTIAYSLKDAGMVDLTVYNVKGQMVKKLVAGTQNPGAHSVVWNGKDSQNKGVGSGIYFYKLTTKNFQSVQKMMLIK